jgi:UDP-N-acetylmuramate dehydrogenase
MLHFIVMTSLPTPANELPASREFEEFFDRLPSSTASNIQPSVALAPFTTLRVGGPADLYFDARDADELAVVIQAAQLSKIDTFLLGGGSNVCICDHGVRGLVVHNRCRFASVGRTTVVDCGYVFWTLFQKAAQASLSGLEFAVGIPGSVGGALVSNAGAYRQNICDIVREIEVVEDGARKPVGPEWMDFSYRDSRLRRPEPATGALIRTTLELTPGSRREILARARDNQRQRIFKQPWLPSAGSFFKNVVSHELAESLPDLPGPMKQAGVVPAGFLSAACGCKGLTVGGAQISRRHGNFVVNSGDATAQEIRTLTGQVKQRVFERFGVRLHEEVMFVGDWPEGDWRALASAGE